jgi:hypothetical protein
MRYSVLLFILFAVACSQPKPAGKRVYLAKGNISFVLPDSTLIYSKPILWPADYKMGSYGEAGALYYSADSSVRISVYVKVYPDPFQRTASWRAISNERSQPQLLSAKNRYLAIIENYKEDSLSRTIEFEYRLNKRQQKNWREQGGYNKILTIYGPQRTVEFCFSGPYNPVSCQSIATTCASLRVNPTYLQAGAKPYPLRAYQD